MVYFFITKKRKNVSDQTKLCSSEFFITKWTIIERGKQTLSMPNPKLNAYNK